jgi:hypothetical protein
LCSGKLLSLLRHVRHPSPLPFTITLPSFHVTCTTCLESESYGDIDATIPFVALLAYRKVPPPFRYQHFAGAHTHAFMFSLTQIILYCWACCSVTGRLCACAYAPGPWSRSQQCPGGSGWSSSSRWSATESWRSIRPAGTTRARIAFMCNRKQLVFKKAN